MSKKHEKMMLDLRRLIDAQNFKSEEELKNFLSSMMGEKIPEFPMEALTFEEQAQDLVYEAFQLPDELGRMKVQKALSLDINCIEAYEYLGMNEDATEFAVVFFEKGANVGRKKFGGEFLKSNQGMFYDMVETRTYMRCLLQYAECMFSMNQLKTAVEIWEEMIALNREDFLKAREPLMITLLRIGEYEKYNRYNKMFPHDNETFAMFTSALYAYTFEGESEHATQLLQAAIKKYKYVAGLLLSSKKLELIAKNRLTEERADAAVYMHFGRGAWQQTHGAIDWLEKHAPKAKKK